MVRLRSEKPYQVTQASERMFVTWAAVVFLDVTAFVRSEYLSAITTMNLMPIFVFEDGAGMSIAMNSSGTFGGNRWSSLQ